MSAEELFDEGALFKKRDKKKKDTLQTGTRTELANKSLSTLVEVI